MLKTYRSAWHMISTLEMLATIITYQDLRFSGPERVNCLLKPLHWGLSCPHPQLPYCRKLEEMVLILIPHTRQVLTERGLRCLLIRNSRPHLPAVSQWELFFLSNHFARQLERHKSKYSYSFCRCGGGELLQFLFVFGVTAKEEPNHLYECLETNI